MSIFPSSAPFTPQQRAWLDGFLSGTLGLEPANGSATNGSAANGAAPALAAPPAPSALPAPAASESKAEAKAALSYGRENPFPARILEVRALCGPGSAKDVRAVTFDLTGSGLTYEAGDALGVYPENAPDLVAGVLAAMEATGEEPVITPEDRIVPARIALRLAYDITRPSDALLSLLLDFANDESERDALRALCDGDEAGWLDGRDIMDVLERFPSARPPLDELAASLTPLQPRLYSIASSQKAHPTQVHLTVGVVRYDLHNRTRRGVASTFLAEREGGGDELAPGQTVGVFVHPSPHFKVPADPNAPIIMTGPGTGIAPFRAFLQERRATGAPGKNWLLFGDQRRETDFLYREELEAFVADGTLTRLDVAFSRDQQQKIYVQDRMIEAAPELWQWLEAGAYFYVCGDAKRMAKDVHAALLKIIQEQGRMDEGAAKAFLQDLSKTHRYARDVY